MISALALAATFTIAQMVELPLGETLGRRGNQISGLAWHAGGEGDEDDRLLFLCQSTWSDWTIFAAMRSDIAAALNKQTPIEVQQVEVEGEPELPDFDGLEAIGVRGDEVYLLVEGRRGDAHLVRGSFTEALRITLRPEVQTITAHNALPNLTCEAICMGPERILVLEEVSCASAQKPGRAIELMDNRSLIFEPLNDRLTDATPLDAAGRFWVSTFEFENELQCAPVDERAPEKLVELQYGDGGIKATSRVIDLNEGREPGAPARNWEGVARWDDTHLLVINDDLPSRARTSLLLVTIP